MQESIFKMGHPSPGFDSGHLLYFLRQLLCLYEAFISLSVENSSDFQSESVHHVLIFISSILLD